MTQDQVNKASNIIFDALTGLTSYEAVGMLEQIKLSIFYSAQEEE